MYLSYYNILKRGVRIALRSKVNDSLITGLRIVDSILPVGRGQRQLILGDRYTGKTSIYLSLLLHCNYLSLLGSIEGLGTKRIFGIYIGINQNLSKLSKLISFIWLINWFSLILASHSSSSSLLSYTLPLIGISIAERLRDRGFDTIISFDDFSKHAKSYRQISLILAKIPSRDAFPSDIFNIHASILERCGKLKLCYYNGTITAFPIIETIANDITEYIATNIISITDGQLYTNKKLFLDSCRPSIDSSLSVSRIGSNAQCKLIKLISVAKKMKVEILVGHHRRHNPLMQKAKELIDNNILGKVRTININCQMYKPDNYFKQAVWKKKDGAGPVLVNLIHDLDLMNYLFGRIIKVFSISQNSLRGFKNEDVSGAVLEFKSGIIATFLSSDSVVSPWSWELTARENEIYPSTEESSYLIGGTKASMSLPNLKLW